MLQPASRVGDDVKHEDWETAQAAPIGLAAGIGIAIFIVATGGTGAVALGIGGAVASAGSLLDFIFVSGECKIKTGAGTVFTNLKASALAHPKCTTTDGHTIVGGADHVFIEESRAGRIEDWSDCKGHIVSGSTAPNQVLMGGTTKLQEKPGWFWGYQAVDWGFSAVSLGSGWKGMGMLEKLYEGGSFAAKTYGLATDTNTSFAPKDVVDSGRSVWGGYSKLSDLLKAAK